LDPCDADLRLAFFGLNELPEASSSDFRLDSASFAVDACPDGECAEVVVLLLAPIALKRSQRVKTTWRPEQVKMTYKVYYKFIDKPVLASLNGNSVK